VTQLFLIPSSLLYALYIVIAFVLEVIYMYIAITLCQVWGTGDCVVVGEDEPCLLLIRGERVKGGEGKGGGEGIYF
jgi:hypothetical protein